MPSVLGMCSEGRVYPALTAQPQNESASLAPKLGRLKPLAASLAPIVEAGTAGLGFISAFPGPSLGNQPYLEGRSAETSKEETHLQCNRNKKDSGTRVSLF